MIALWSNNLISRNLNLKSLPVSISAAEVHVCRNLELLACRTRRGNMQISGEPVIVPIRPRERAARERRLSRRVVEFAPPDDAIGRQTRRPCVPILAAWVLRLVSLCFDE